MNIERRGSWVNGVSEGVGGILVRTASAISNACEEVIAEGCCSAQSIVVGAWSYVM